MRLARSFMAFDEVGVVGKNGIDTFEQARRGDLCILKGQVVVTYGDLQHILRQGHNLK